MVHGEWGQGEIGVYSPRNSQDSSWSPPRERCSLNYVGITLAALGHGDTRMVEKHYGYLAPSHVAEMIRENLPRFGACIESNVADARHARGRTG